MNRLEVRERLLDCTACELHKVGSGPVPFHGPAPCYLAIVGEAPGKVEDQKGRPFVGPAGQLLRDALTEAGLDPEQIFYANAASCFPNRRPTATEVTACSPNLEMQIALAKPVWICLLGAVALSTMRPDLKISRARGHVLRPPERPQRVFVTFHPAHALRNAKDERVFRQDLKTLAEMMDADPNYQHLVDDSCVACGTDPEILGDHDEHLRFDSWEVSYCGSCFAVAPEAKREAKAEAKRDRDQERTGRLFA